MTVKLVRGDAGPPEVRRGRMVAVMHADSVSAARGVLEVLRALEPGRPATALGSWLIRDDLDGRWEWAPKTPLSLVPAIVEFPCDPLGDHMARCVDPSCQLCCLPQGAR